MRDTDANLYTTVESTFHRGLRKMVVDREEELTYWETLGKLTVDATF